jgi:flavodoxin
MFVHSQSGNTAKLALAVTHLLREKGQDVDVELLRPVGKVAPRSRHVELKKPPETEEYEIVLFGGPIWGFAASPVIVSALNQIKSLKGKNAMFFLTSFLPPQLSGSNGAQKKIKGQLEELNATVLEGESLSWGLYCGKKRMDETVRKICEKVMKSII